MHKPGLGLYISMQVRFEDMFCFYADWKSATLALEPYKNLFPVKPSERLAGIIGDIFGDGHLQGPPFWRIDYTSSHLCELRRFGREVKLLFGVEGKPRPCRTNSWSSSWNYGVNCKTVARIIYLFGAPIGNKTNQTYNIPPWIAERREFFRRFIQRLFDCEGTIDTSRIRVEIELWKREDLANAGLEFMKGLSCSLHEHFGIQCYRPFLTGGYNVRTDGSHSVGIKLRIPEREVQKFVHEIGFETKIKRMKLNALLKGAAD
jgi:hypothetical protein